MMLIRSMRFMNLRNLDLNLLVLLNALLEERSVTNAAEALGMSQPAMSHALARLRETFDDRLLVRSGREMIPTSRAEAIQAKLRAILEDVEDIVVPEVPFDPAYSNRSFRLLTNGFGGYAFVPHLMQELNARGSAIDLRVEVHAADDLRDRLGVGRADLALITSEMQRLPLSLKHRKLYDDPFVCVIRRENPALNASNELSVDDYVALNHVLVSPRGDSTGVVDGVLAATGKQRRVAVVVPNFLAVPGIIKNSDCVVTVPRTIASLFSAEPELTTIVPPLELPVGTLFALWHERVHEDAANQWFRQVVVAAAEQMRKQREG